jgi:glutamine cyclotransferase
VFTGVTFLCLAWAAAAPLLAFQAAGARRQAARIYDAQIVATYPHSIDSFCQGLEFSEGALYEGTGLYGESKLRRVDLTTGKVLKEAALDASHFGEGITVMGDRIYQLTWQSRVGFIYDKTTFRQVGTFRYTGEGWGLTHDEKHLILSDGTPTLRFLDPKTFKVVKRVRVTDRGQPVKDLNELEYIKGEIYANIWNTGYIVRINPGTGAVTGWVDLRGLSPREKYGSNAVLNGIAHDPTTDKLYVTGKNWSDLFEIKLVPRN